MESHRAGVALIDFGAGAPTPHVSYSARLPLGAISFSRCYFPPNPGVTLGSTQSIVAVHANPSFKLSWRDPERDVLRQDTISNGEMNVARADLPVFHHWDERVKALIIAIDSDFVSQIFVQAFERDAEQLPVIIGAADPTVRRLAALCDSEIEQAGAAGRLYAEGLATSLIIHLFRRYARQVESRSRFNGGLTAAQLRQVLGYIEDCIDEDLGLADLAALAGLSTHHFAHAFKVSTGLPPHYYVIDRRVHRVKELLLVGDRSLAQIANDVGFSSQSHMTLNFRKRTGVTPARYRRELQSSALVSEEQPSARHSTLFKSAG